MTKLKDLYNTSGQSPWLDNLRRGWITSGELSRWVDRGVRGITSNPSIFAKAIAGAHDYDDQFRTLVTGGSTVEDSYWDMVTDDIGEALRILRPIYDESHGGDGFVSVEVDPDLAHGSLRITTGPETTTEDVDAALSAIRAVLPRLRAVPGVHPKVATPA